MKSRITTIFLLFLSTFLVSILPFLIKNRSSYAMENQCLSCTSNKCCYSSCPTCYSKCDSDKICVENNQTGFCSCQTPTPTPTQQAPVPTATPTSGAGGGGGGGGGGPTATPTPTSTPAPQCKPNPGYVDWGTCQHAGQCPSSTSSVSCTAEGRCRYSGNLKPCPSSSCPSYWVPGGWSCARTPNEVTAPQIDVNPGNLIQDYSDPDRYHVQGH